MSRVVVTGGSIEVIVNQMARDIPTEMASRAYRASNELRNSALEVLRGQRSGRMYGGHQASAPGEPPAVWSGTFRLSWQPRTYIETPTFKSTIETDVGYAGILENGTPGGQMAPRPHHELIKEKALPEITRIYGEPYDL